MIRSLTLATIAALAVLPAPGDVAAWNVPVGTVMGFTGPVEALVPDVAAAAAAERLADAGAVAPIGAACSGPTAATLVGVARPPGLAMVAPSASSPGPSAMEDDGLSFRVVPSDAREGEVLAGAMREAGAPSG